MRLAPLIGPDLQDAIAIGPDAVREAVSEFHPEDIAELLEDRQFFLLPNLQSLVQLPLQSVDVCDLALGHCQVV